MSENLREKAQVLSAFENSSEQIQEHFSDLLKTIRKNVKSNH